MKRTQMCARLCVCVLLFLFAFVCVLLKHFMEDVYTNESFSWPCQALAKIHSAHCDSVYQSVCPVPAVGVTVCHLWVSFQVILPRRAAFTAILQSHRLRLTRTGRHTSTDEWLRLPHRAAVNTGLAEVRCDPSSLYKCEELQSH